MKKRDGNCILFIDYKSAYNTVNRTKLWEILRKNGIFTEQEIKFLECIHNKIYFRVNGQKYYFQNGVGQGLSTSPGLFNIYMEEVIKCLKE